MGSRGLKEPCIDEGPDPPWEAAIVRGMGMPEQARRQSAVSCAQTAEPIEMLFEVWTRVSKKNHVSDEVLDTKKGFKGYLAPLKSIVKHRILGVG